MERGEVDGVAEEGVGCAGGVGEDVDAGQGHGGAVVF